MPNRLVFPLITLFWVCMNVLLWRSEFKGATEFGGSIPARIVWEKILTAPDDSTLEITRNGTKIGYCRWRPNVGEELRTGKVPADRIELEGMVQQLSGYLIDVEGSLMLEEWEKRLRFNLHGAFETNLVWKEFIARTAIRSNEWEIHALSKEETLSIRAEMEDTRWEKSLTFAELRNPPALLENLGGPMIPLLLRNWGIDDSGASLSFGLQWEARNGWFAIGHSRLRVYRVQARLFDRHEILVVVSRVGEILRIELPNRIVLLNESFVGL